MMPKKKTPENTQKVQNQKEKNQSTSSKESRFSNFLHSDGKHILTIGFLSGFVSCAILISLAIAILFPDLSFSGRENSRARLEQAGQQQSLTSDAAKEREDNELDPEPSQSDSFVEETWQSEPFQSEQTQIEQPALTENSVSAGDKYIRNDLLWTGRQGYLLGLYLPAYPMNLRMEPLTDADEAGQIQALEPLNIVEITEGLEESVWGRTDKGPWILLQDRGALYCFGPGEYEAIDPLAILSPSHEEVSHFRSQQHFFADQIFTQSGAVYGVLSDGNQVILWNQVSTVER